MNLNKLETTKILQTYILLTLSNIHELKEVRLR